MAEQDGLLVRFWGVRGTLPCPGLRTVRYGGNTACVEVLCGDQRLIFDAGTGLRDLGKSLMANGEPIASHLFFSHTHFDHVIGLPFFRPAYDPKNRVELWSGHLAVQGRRLQEVLETLMAPPFFPVPLDIMRACLAFHDFEAGTALCLAEGIEVRTAPLNHPGGATGYRVECCGRSVCYVTDTEHPEHGRDASILGLIEGADLVIYDATYTDEEYERFRGWGHSTWQEGVRLCEAAGAARLVAFHHDPDHDDDAMDRIAEALDRQRPGSLVAREGLEIGLQP
jgi:phosphoribosyl 1,2-cyclic phosphodiesterase